MRAILSLRPGAAEIANRAVAQEVGEVGVGFDVRGPKGTPPEYLVEGEHGAVDVAKIANQEDLFRLWVELPNQPGEIVGAVLLSHVFDIGLALAGRDTQVCFLRAALAESSEILHVVASHPFAKTGRHRYWLGVERVVADPLLVGLEVISLGRVVRVSRFSERLEHVPPVAGCAQLIRVPTMDDDLGMLREEAHRPGRAGATPDWTGSWRSATLPRRDLVPSASTARNWRLDPGSSPITLTQVRKPLVPEPGELG